MLFLGIVADPEETHAVWYGMLNTLGIFDLSMLTDVEHMNYARKRHYFWFGEVGMAGIMAGSIAVPCRDFSGGSGGDLISMYRDINPVPPAFRLPAQTDPTGHESRYQFSNQRIREE